MLGAIIGDVIGSVYEFDNYRSKDFVLFGRDNFLTDDSIMTLAVMEIMRERLYYDKNKIIDTFKKWGRAYPNRGYGGMFSKWLFSDMRDSYNSFGNGAAMRISPVGYYAKNEEEVIEISRRITEVTHSHPEGIKGAEVTAMCIYYAKIGKSKEFIREYVSKHYNIDFKYDNLKENYYFNETCQNTVPQAIYCFLISKDYEDCIRTTISIGGDSDTLAAISGAIAEAYYKHIDRNIVNNFIKYIPKPSNGCYPLKLIDDYFYYNSCHLCTSEEIEANTKILSTILEDGNAKTLHFNYSKQLKALLDCALDSIFYSYPKLRADNWFYNETNAINIVEEANDFLKKCKEKYSLHFTFQVYETPLEALSILESTNNVVSNEVYNDIFNNSYKVL